MSEELIIRHCSPTLAGIKTGNLFTCKFTDKSEVNQNIRALNRKLVPKGLRLIPLRFSDTKVLIYLYRPQKLKEDFYQESIIHLLTDYGYTVMNVDHCVAQLRRKLSQKEDFPHEIGCFLGYPAEDVLGFIENGANNCKYCGFWKVYGDEHSAKKLFKKYKKCTDVYSKQWSQGKDIEQLIVAV